MRKLRIIDFVIIAAITVMVVSTLVWAATFYPFSNGLDGGASGDLDSKTSTADKDVGMVVVNADSVVTDFRSITGAMGAIFALNADGAASQSLPGIVDSGDGGNEDWNLVPLMAQGFYATNGATGGGWVRFFEDQDNGNNYASVVGPATLASNITLTLTTTAGTIYSSGDTPGGELGGTWASPTVDDTGITLTSITIGSLLGVDSIDVTGAADIDIGSADVTDVTIITDGGADSLTIGNNADLDFGITFDSDTNDCTINFDEDNNILQVSSPLAQRSQTPMTDDCDNFNSNFTGNYLYGGTFVCNATGTCVLPAVSAGANFTIITMNTTCIIDPNGSDSMLTDGTQQLDGENITSTGSAGDIAVVQYYSAAGWLTTTNGWTQE